MSVAVLGIKMANPTNGVEKVEDEMNSEHFIVSESKEIFLKKKDGSCHKDTGATGRSSHEQDQGQLAFNIIKDGDELLQKNV